MGLVARAAYENAMAAPEFQRSSTAKATVGNAMTLADGGYPDTGLVMPHRRRAGEEDPARLPLAV